MLKCPAPTWAQVPSLGSWLVVPGLSQAKRDQSLMCLCRCAHTKPASGGVPGRVVAARASGDGEVRRDPVSAQDQIHCAGADSDRARRIGCHPVCELPCDRNPEDRRSFGFRGIIRTRRLDHKPDAWAKPGRQREPGGQGTGLRAEPVQPAVDRGLGLR